MKIFSTVLLSFLIYCPLFGQGDNGALLDLDLKNIQETIQQVPEKGSNSFTSTFLILTLPMPDGTEIDFFVTHAPMVDQKNPLYNTTAANTYNLNSVEVAGYSGTMVMYPNGIHATLHTPQGLMFIKRTNELNKHEYVYFKDTEGFPHSPDDAKRLDNYEQDNSVLEHRHSIEKETHSHAIPRFLANNNFYTVGNENRRVLDLFMLSEQSFVDQFTSDGSGTAAEKANARVVEIVNGVRAIWEKDFNLTVNYMGVYFHPSQVGGSGTNAQNLFNNTVTDANVNGGTKADVDLSHLLAGNGGGGSAALWSACGSFKASGYSGTGNVQSVSYIALVAHEMAHHLGADHTWTGSASNCTADQYGEGSGVEPGAGTSLASYEGICGSDNIPNVSKGSFHHIESIREIVEFVNNEKRKPPGGTNGAFFNAAPTGVGVIPPFNTNISGGCFTTTSNNGNVIPIANANAGNLGNLNLPARTPFELTGGATDGNSDPLTFQWDQMDFALTRASLDAYTTRPDGPLFKSVGPTANPSRTFPQLNDILSGTESQGEMTAKTNRRMRFALTVQDGKGGVGVDTVSFNVVDAGVGFSITESINTGTPSNVAVNWNVANTTASPISCSNVDILYSTDGGQTFPFVLKSNVANDGNETVDISSFNTTMGRIKVKCSTSIFFDINNANLTVTGGTCNAQTSTICPTSTVTANSGDNSLDLDETKKIIGSSFSSKNLTISGNQGSSPTGSNGTCAATNFNEFHSYFTFTVSQTGTYSFNQPPDLGVLSLFQTDNYTYNANNACDASFIASNFSQGGSGLGAVSATLQACTKYTVVVSNETNGKTVDITISGPGSAVEELPLNGGTSYTFIAVNTANNQIAQVDANADFKTLTDGTYQVYGTSYLSTIDVSTWVGSTTDAVFTVSTCALRTDNFHTLIVSGGSPPSNPGFGESGCGGTTNFTITDANIPATNGIFQTNGTIETSGTVNVESSDGAIIFKSATSVTLKQGFHAMASSNFIASIANCTVLTETPTEEVEFIATDESTPLSESIAEPIKVANLATKVAIADFKIVPNPLSQKANFLFNLVESVPVDISIFNMNGQLISTVAQSNSMSKGVNQISYDVQHLKGGMFIVVLRTGQEVQTKKMIVIE